MNWKYFGIGAAISFATLFLIAGTAILANYIQARFGAGWAAGAAALCIGIAFSAFLGFMMRED